MKPELINNYLKDTQKTAEKISLEPDQTKQAIMWLQHIEKILEPIWQDGYDEGLKEGIKKEKEKARILKSN